MPAYHTDIVEDGVEHAGKDTHHIAADAPGVMCDMAAGEPVSRHDGNTHPDSFPVNAAEVSG